MKRFQLQTRGVEAAEQIMRRLGVKRGTGPRCAKALSCGLPSKADTCALSSDRLRPCEKSGFAGN
jgi:hypothetical protein